jgi:hypothetical protein
MQTAVYSTQSIGRFVLGISPYGKRPMSDVECGKDVMTIDHRTRLSRLDIPEVKSD